MYFGHGKSIWVKSVKPSISIIGLVLGSMFGPVQKSSFILIYCQGFIDNDEWRDCLYIWLSFSMFGLHPVPWERSWKQWILLQLPGPLLHPRNRSHLVYQHIPISTDSSHNFIYDIYIIIHYLSNQGHINKSSNKSFRCILKWYLVV